MDLERKGLSQERISIMFIPCHVVGFDFLETDDVIRRWDLRKSASISG